MKFRFPIHQYGKRAGSNPVEYKTLVTAPEFRALTPQLDALLPFAWKEGDTTHKPVWAFAPHPSDASLGIICLFEDCGKSGGARHVLRRTLGLCQREDAPLLAAIAGGQIPRMQLDWMRRTWVLECEPSARPFPWEACVLNTAEPDSFISPVFKAPPVPEKEPSEVDDIPDAEDVVLEEAPSVSPHGPASDKRESPQVESALPSACVPRSEPHSEPTVEPASSAEAEGAMSPEVLTPPPARGKSEPAPEIRQEESRAGRLRPGRKLLVVGALFMFILLSLWLAYTVAYQREKEQNEWLRQQVSALQGDLEEASAGVVRLTREKTVLETDRRSAQQQITELASTVQKLTADRDSLQAALLGTKDLHAQVAQEFDKLRRENAAFRKLLEEAESRELEDRLRMEKLEAELKLLKSKTSGSTTRRRG